MTPDNAKVISDFLCAAFGNEMATTKRVIQALPEDKITWQPHEKGFTAGNLAWHMVLAEEFFLTAVVNGAFPDFGKAECPATVAGILAHYDAQVPALLEKVKALTGEQASKIISFHTFTFPAVVFLNLANSHGIHHRGQLAAYLRAMGTKVPAIYGESADSKAAAA